MNTLMKAAAAAAVLSSFPAFAQEASLDDALLMKDGYDFAAKEKLSAAEVEHDIAFLQYALQNGYSGARHGAPSAVKRAIDGLGRLAGKRDYSSQSLCDEIATVLDRVPDRHLSVWHMKARCGTFPMRQAEKIPSVGGNYAKDRKKPWEINEVEAGKIRVPAVSLINLFDPQDPSWKELYEKLRALTETAPALILDLRGNGGGDNSIAGEIASILYGGQKFPFAELAVSALQTPAAFALKANDYKWEMTSARLQGRPAPDHLTKAYEQAISSFTLAKGGKIPAETVTAFYHEGLSLDQEKLFKGPIYLLTDRRCASACESMLEMFEGHPRAVTVGDNTAGMIHFRPRDRHLVLPASQIHLDLSSRYNRYKDGRFVERRGYAPKIRVPEGRDALKAAIKLLVAQGLDGVKP